MKRQIAQRAAHNLDPASTDTAQQPDQVAAPIRAELDQTPEWWDRQYQQLIRAHIPRDIASHRAHNLLVHHTLTSTTPHHYCTDCGVDLDPHSPATQPPRSPQDRRGTVASDRQLKGTTMTTADEALRLPPEDAWIERRIEPTTTETGFASEKTDGIPTGGQRITGNLRGAWPRHGVVRTIPSGDHDLQITEAELIVLSDGTVHAARR